jgi:hypothetical protein
MDKRHFTVVEKNGKEHGLYVSSTPSSAAKKAVSKLCSSNKNKKVEFSLREITQGSKKKVYGPYIGEMKKLKTPIELKGRIIRYQIKLNLKKNMKGGNEKNIHSVHNSGSSASEAHNSGASASESHNSGASVLELPKDFQKMCADTARNPIYTRQIEFARMNPYDDISSSLAKFVEIIKKASNGNGCLSLKTNFERGSHEFKKLNGNPSTHFIISNILVELNNHWNEYVSLFFNQQKDSLDTLMIKIWQNVIYQAYLNLKKIYGESFRQTMEEPDTYKFSGLTIPKTIAK